MQIGTELPLSFVVVELCVLTSIFIERLYENLKYKPSDVHRKSELVSQNLYLKNIKFSISQGKNLSLQTDLLPVDSLALC